MAIKIVIVETVKFHGLPDLWPDVKRVGATDGTEKVSEALRELNGSTTLVVASAELRNSPCFEAALAAPGTRTTVAYIGEPEDFTLCSGTLMQFMAEQRATGVKTFLEKGSSIFSEALFNAGAAGEKLDSCFRFAHGKLTPGRAVDAWGALQSLVFVGIKSLPNQGENGTGERVDVQVGADANRFVFSVRFDNPASEAERMRRAPLLEVLRTSCDVFEVRSLTGTNKLEILGFVFTGACPKKPVEIHTCQVDAGLETATDVREYEFRGFHALAGGGPEEKRVFKGGFKKKFSDKVMVAAPDPVEAPAEVRIAADAPKAESKTVVSGGAALGGKGKSASLLESKIAGLEANLKQRDELIVKLNKEIEEIKDPLKMGVISGIKDNQVEGLKANIARLQTESEEAQKREKELMGVVDKAIALKDEAVKRLKDYESKLRQSQGGNNSKVVALERQLDEQKRQNKELSKRITQLMEQLNGKAA